MPHNMVCRLKPILLQGLPLPGHNDPPGSAYALLQNRRGMRPTQPDRETVFFGNRPRLLLGRKVVANRACASANNRWCVEDVTSICDRQNTRRRHVRLGGVLRSVEKRARRHFRTRNSALFPRRPEIFVLDPECELSTHPSPRLCVRAPSEFSKKYELHQRPVSIYLFPGNCRQKYIAWRSSSTSISDKVSHEKNTWIANEFVACRPAGALISRSTLRM